MTQKKLDLVHEQSSPLFRIMWVHNDDEPARRGFDNNICAFHVGKGFVLSVAHNLRTEAQFFKSMKEIDFQTKIMPFVAPNLQQLFKNSFFLDSATQKRYINIPNPIDVQTVTNELQRINYDSRWIALYEQKICKPYLIVQFRTSEFYQDPSLTALFNSNQYFFEPQLNRYTFLIEVELVKAFYNDDIALYRIINTPKAIVDRLASVEIDYNLHDSETQSYCCLQSSPVNNLGRLVNDAKIEGLLDHWNLMNDRIGGNYLLDGTRYLIKGYFRFGSSGAPYLVYDATTGKYKANSIQSEASPIQLLINNKQDGNFQYINAIASPLLNIKEELEQIMHSPS